MATFFWKWATFPNSFRNASFQKWWPIIQNFWKCVRFSVFCFFLRHTIYHPLIYYFWINLWRDVYGKFHTLPLDVNLLYFKILVPLLSTFYVQKAVCEIYHKYPPMGYKIDRQTTGFKKLKATVCLVLIRQFDKLCLDLGLHLR